MFRRAEPGPGKQLKNKVSNRIIPIHSQLIGLGLPEWMPKGAGRVFPAMFLKGSALVSLWISEIVLKGFKTPALSLHSLRHTLTQKLTKARTFAALQNRLLGHAIGSSVEERVYLGSLEFSVKELSEALEKVSFPLSLPEV